VRKWVVSPVILLVALAVLAVTSPAFADDTRQVTVMLKGTNEAPGPGDPDGSGTAVLTLKAKEGTVCYDITVTNITLPAAAAHIHKAPAGVAGPVLIPFAAPNANGVSSGCVTGLPAKEIEAIIKHPADYYVNVHNMNYPAGAARGQLPDPKVK
jgi:hypothetical protein